MKRRGQSTHDQGDGWKDPFTEQSKGKGAGQGSRQMSWLQTLLSMGPTQT